VPGERDTREERPTSPEDAEDLDWLNEDEDPRSQIVEDDDAEPGREEDW
jgi:hypothetical protein